MIEGRPRSLPIAPRPEPALRHLPLAAAARAVDRQWRPIYAVWELTLKCDLACAHCGPRAAVRAGEVALERELPDRVDGPPLAVDGARGSRQRQVAQRRLWTRGDGQRTRASFNHRAGFQQSLRQPERMAFQAH